MVQLPTRDPIPGHVVDQALQENKKGVCYSSSQTVCEKHSCPVPPYKWSLDV